MPVAEWAGVEMCSEMGRKVWKQEDSIWCYMR